MLRILASDIGFLSSEFIDEHIDNGPMNDEGTEWK